MKYEERLTRRRYSSPYNPLRSAPAQYGTLRPPPLPTSAVSRVSVAAGLEERDQRHRMFSTL
jgi:hypothetical protein